MKNPKHGPVPTYFFPSRKKKKKEGESSKPSFWLTASREGFSDLCAQQFTPEPEKMPGITLQNAKRHGTLT